MRTTIKFCGIHRTSILSSNRYDAVCLIRSVGDATFSCSHGVTNDNTRTITSTTNKSLNFTELMISDRHTRSNKFDLISMIKTADCHFFFFEKVFLQVGTFSTTSRRFGSVMAIAASRAVLAMRAAAAVHWTACCVRQRLVISTRTKLKDILNDRTPRIAKQSQTYQELKVLVFRAHITEIITEGVLW